MSDGAGKRLPIVFALCHECMSGISAGMEPQFDGRLFQYAVWQCEHLSPAQVREVMGWQEKTHSHQWTRTLEGKRTRRKLAA